MQECAFCVQGFYSTLCVFKQVFHKICEIFAYFWHNIGTNGCQFSTLLLVWRIRLEELSCKFVLHVVSESPCYIMLIMFEKIPAEILCQYLVFSWNWLLYSPVVDSSSLIRYSSYFICQHTPCVLVQYWCCNCCFLFNIVSNSLSSSCESEWNIGMLLWCSWRIYWICYSFNDASMELRRQDC